MAEAVPVQKMPCKHGKSCFMRNNPRHEKAYFHPDQLLPTMASPSVKTSLASYVSPYKSVETVSPGDDDFSGDDDDSSDDEEEVVRIAPHERAYQMRATAAKEDQRKFAGSIASGKIGATGPTGQAPKTKARRRGPPKAAASSGSAVPANTPSSTPVSLGHASAGSHKYQPPPSPHAITATPSSGGSGISKATPPSFNAAQLPTDSNNFGSSSPYSAPAARNDSAAHSSAASDKGSSQPPRFCRECGLKFETTSEMFCGDCGAKRL